MIDDQEIYHGLDSRLSYLLTVDADGTRVLRVREVGEDWSDPVVLAPLSEAPC